MMSSLMHRDVFSNIRQLGTRSQGISEKYRDTERACLSKRVVYKGESSRVNVNSHSTVPFILPSLGLWTDQGLL